MSPDINNLIQNTTSFAVTAGLLTYLIKSLTNQQLKKDLELFKLNLVKEAEKEKIQYGILQERRAVVIEKLFKYLFRYRRDLHYAIANGYLNAENKTYYTKELSESFKAVTDYYNEHKLYLDKNSCEKVFQFMSPLATAGVEMQFADLEKLSQSEKQQLVKKHQEIFFDKRYDELEEILCESFRKILGV